MKKNILTVLFLFLVITVFAQKQVYIPRFITSVNMDLNNCTSQWCYSRSIQTDNIVVFWESGFGSDPSTAVAPYKVNMTNLLAVAEKAYATYLDSLKFATKGSSVTDKYKLMIFLLYSADWAAYGSGQDDLVGTLHVNPAAANINSVLAHEIGHCFEYITGCDTQGGWRYGFGTNGSGGNGFWEQCAQWMAFKMYPTLQFSDGDFREYVKNNHKHIIHETPRYANYFVQDYWTYKRGIEFMGRLWRESRRPEDPIEAYKRINGITQEQFNDEMYEHASRLTTWDLPSIKAYGANYIDARAQVKMNLTADNYWMIDSSICIENYGYNSIKLNAPSQERVLTVRFRGKAGQSGFRALNTSKGGWRFGFVALLNDGTRVYSIMGTAKVVNGNTAEQTLSFTCPANCAKLWLVVSGSPQEHWKHAWDDNDANDEQWPYQIQFDNTNLLGKFTTPIHDETLTYNVLMDPMTTYTATPVSLNTSLISEAFAMSPDDMLQNLGTKIIYNGLNPNGSLNPTSTANAPGHWFSNTGQTVGWGTSAYLFSELNIGSLVANIGQYPSKCVPGQTYTIKQVLVYTKSPTETATVTLIFNITIKSATPTTYTLATTVVGSGTVSPANGSFNYNTVQTLTATPATGYTFTGWSGDATGTTNPLSVTMTANKNITATFTINKYTLATTVVGSGTVNPANGSFNYNTVQTLTATPATGYTFTGWSGDATGTTNPLSVTMTANKNITATFTINKYTLATTVVGSGAVSPANGSFNYNTVQTLTATPATGYTFTGWSGDATGTTNPLSVTMTANKNITATFTINKYALATTVVGSGAVSPANGSFNYNTVQTLTATPATGYTFTGWSGGATGTTNPLSVTMTANKTITATFTINKYTLATTVVGSGTVSPSNGSFNYNTVQTLTATPATGYTFTGWSGDATGTTNPLSVTMTANKTITATFTINKYTLATTVVGSGTVSPANGSFNYNTVQTLTVTPATGYTFTGWSGDATGTTNPLSVTMTANKTITATFTAIAVSNYTLNVSIVGIGSVSPSAGSYSEGTVQTITATPATGYTFTGWSGDATGTTNPLSVTMAANKNITATFAAVSTDINNSLTKAKISISPNPSNTSFKAEFGIPVDMDVYTMDGKLVSNYKNVNSIVFGDELAAGLYIVKAGNEYLKIIKE